MAARHCCNPRLQHSKAARSFYTGSTPGGRQFGLVSPDRLRQATVETHVLLPVGSYLTSSSNKLQSLASEDGWGHQARDRIRNQLPFSDCGRFKLRASPGRQMRYNIVLSCRGCLHSSRTRYPERTILIHTWPQFYTSCCRACRFLSLYLVNQYTASRRRALDHHFPKR